MPPRLAARTAAPTVERTGGAAGAATPVEPTGDGGEREVIIDRSRGWVLVVDRDGGVSALDDDVATYGFDPVR